MSCERNPLKLLNKTLEKYLQKSSFLVRLQVLKIIHSHVFFRVFAKSLSNLVHDFLEDCFPKTKLLLAANRLIYLNISIGLSKMQSLAPSCTIAGFLCRISTSGVKNRPVLKKNSHLFHEIENAASLYCEDNYNL